MRRRPGTKPTGLTLPPLIYSLGDIQIRNIPVSRENISNEIYIMVLLFVIVYYDGSNRLVVSPVVWMVTT